MDTGLSDSKNRTSSPRSFPNSTTFDRPSGAGTSRMPFASTPDRSAMKRKTVSLPPAARRCVSTGGMKPGCVASAPAIDRTRRAVCGDRPRRTISFSSGGSDAISAPTRADVSCLGAGFGARGGSASDRRTSSRNALRCASSSFVRRPAMRSICARERLRCFAISSARARLPSTHASTASFVGAPPETSSGTTGCVVARARSAISASAMTGVATARSSVPRTGTMTPSCSPREMRPSVSSSSRDMSTASAMTLCQAASSAIAPATAPSRAARYSAYACAFCGVMVGSDPNRSASARSSGADCTARSASMRPFPCMTPPTSAPTTAASGMDPMASLRTCDVHSGWSSYQRSNSGSERRAMLARNPCATVDPKPAATLADAPLSAPTMRPDSIPATASRVPAAATASLTAFVAPTPKASAVTALATISVAAPTMPSWMAPRAASRSLMPCCLRAA